MSVLRPFSAPVRRWFEQSFDGPTEVQRRGWPILRDGGHGLLLAPTGSGKTLAAFLACIDRLSRPDAPAPEGDGFRVVYVSPLKALVYDIERNLRAPLVGIANAASAMGLGARGVRVDVRTGDTSQRDRAAMTRRPGDVLVTTPESLYLMLGSSARETLKQVETIIVDEIHVMAGTKRGVHLALTLERLAALSEHEPQRIGLSATQRPLEEVARYLGGGREVHIVDTSEPPHIELRIVVPVADMERPLTVEASATGGEGQRQAVGVVDDEAAPRRGQGMWPVIYPRLLELIRAHRSTIVFTNSRLLCERLAQRLNELAGEELVRAHHGSISHAQRRVVEEQLKAGSLPGIVATSSLELGIDMGAVDLVVLVESPGSVASGLQRIGRAGHGVGERSIGRIFPKYRADLVEAAVVADHMARGLVESTRVPRNCLDVLAQQVVAMVAMGDWEVDALLALVRRAYPYAELSRAQLIGVLDMLSGRYPSEAFAELSPRITWDRATDVLTARKGSRMLVSLNAGTIPDRGLYAVFMVGDGPRLGELDEEMVYESRKGDLIILGASTWRIEDITRDKVVVSPAPGEPGRLPFWHGDRPGRPLELGQAVGAFLRQLVRGEADSPHLDDHALRNLTAYVQEQAEATGAVPTDKKVVVECFRDELGDWRVCLLSPLGSRVMAPWGLALEATYQRMGADVNVLWTDDGICLRFPDVEELPPLDGLFPDPDEVEELVVEQLAGSALFASRFRENAARALLLPRRRGKGRTPLWQQRLKAQNLQQVAMGFPGFPIVLETYRECLQEAFDLPSVIEVLRGVQQRTITVHQVETKRPSPFARSLAFAFVAAFMYAGDAPLAERRAQALTLDRDLLRDLLGGEELRELLDPVSLAELEAELQRLLPERRVRSADALHDLLRRLGELSVDELQQRCDGPAEAWLRELELARRAVPVRLAGEVRWVAVEDAGLYRDGLGVALPPGLPGVFLDEQERALERLLLRWAKGHGPFVAAPIAKRWGVPQGAVVAVLDALEASGQLVRGEMRPGGTQREWCDPEVLRRLRRRSLARARQEVEPVDAQVYTRFLLSWHGLGGTRGGLDRLREVVEQLQGAALPASQLDSLLSRRVSGYRPEQLDQLGAMGEVVWVGRGAVGARDGRVALYPRSRVHLLLDAAEVPDGAFTDTEDGPLRERLYTHLTERGASFAAGLLAVAEGASLAAVAQALWALAWGGLVTNDTFAPLRQLGARRRRVGQVPGAGGRWSAVAELVLLPATDTERAHARSQMLLERYGIATAAAAQADGLVGGFSAVYPVLRAMEGSGKVRRGWFVDGIEGAQFASPGVVDRLRGYREAKEGELVVLPATDPANPYGVVLPWPPSSGRPRRALGYEVVLHEGAAVLFVDRRGRSVISLGADVDDELWVAGFRAWAAAGRRRRLEIEQIDGEPARKSPRSAGLKARGFLETYKGFALPDD